MVVMVFERVRPGLRGELTRWMLEPKAGVFVGRLSGAVRDALWEKACSNLSGGAATLIYQTNSEQGYVMRTWGRTKRRIENHEGGPVGCGVERSRARLSAPIAPLTWRAVAGKGSIVRALLESGTS